MRRPVARALLRALRLGAVLLLALVAVPSASVRQPSLSLLDVETAKGVDFSDGRVWVLVLGEDAAGLTDAMQLVGIDADSGSAVSLGIPRDAWLEAPQPVGLGRINEVYNEGGPEVVSAVVGELTGITPDLVLVVGFDGFRDLVGLLGPVAVHTPQGFVNDGVRVHEGRNRFGPGEALAYVRYRTDLTNYDFDRSANQQRLMIGALAALRDAEDSVGVMERGTLAAIAGVETDLGPADLYRLAQFITTVHPTRVDTCVLPGRFETVEPSGASVVDLDETAALRVGDDAADDVRLQDGCPGVRAY